MNVVDSVMRENGEIPASAYRFSRDSSDKVFIMAEVFT